MDFLVAGLQALLSFRISTDKIALLTLVKEDRLFALNCDESD